MSGLRYSYITNGLADHRLPEALRFLAANGYAGVGLTLDHQHLDPLSPSFARDAEATARVLDELDLSVVIETGGRFVLDPVRKHQPTLLSDDGREFRLEFLKTAVRTAAVLGAEAVSFWSGKKPEDVDYSTAWKRLVDGCRDLADVAIEHEVLLAFEPEPGMFIQTMDEWERLAGDVDRPNFGMTLDIGHCHCIEIESPAECIRRAGDRLFNVQIEDMNRGVHDHLDFGAGTVDFNAALLALREVGYAGLVSVELSRHSHTAHTVVPRAITFLQEREAAGQWLVGARAQIVDDVTAVRTLFPSAARNAGRDHAIDARIALLTASPDTVGELAELYRFGDGDEKLAILLSLEHVHGGEVGLTIVRDAIRSNDKRLVAAALGPFAFTHLSKDELDQAIVKCVFMEIPLTSIDGIETAANPDLARMLCELVHERVAAGRTIAAEVWTLIDANPPHEVLRRVYAELQSEVETRRDAAIDALSKRRGNK